MGRHQENRYNQGWYLPELTNHIEIITVRFKFLVVFFSYPNIFLSRRDTRAVDRVGAGRGAQGQEGLQAGGTLGEKDT